MFWQDLFVSVAGGLVAGLAVLFAGRWALDVPAQQSERDERVAAYLDTVHRELLYNRKTRVEALKALDDPETMMWPLFETVGADIVRTPDAVRTLAPTVLDEILTAYNRLRSANELKDRLDRMTDVIAERIGDKFPPIAPPTLAERATELRARLIDRLQELEPHLDAAINSTEPVP